LVAAAKGGNKKKRASWVAPLALAESEVSNDIRYKPF
jgi:hypothetical protein